jgi:4-amino-4-deoxy-L-arabinose transferase-like glycosyltransferase
VRRGLALLLLAYVLAALVSMRDAPLANRAEDRCWQVVRGMVESGDWLLPRYDGAIRLNKPPLAYWLGASVSTAAGEPSLLALRLPSLAAGIALLLVVFAWGRSLGGPRLGLAAAACLLAMESFFALSCRGVAEMELALFTSLALFAFDRALREPGVGPRAVFGLALGLALLAKASAALLIVALPVVLVLTARGLWRRALAPRNAVWLLVALAIGAAWYVVILVTVPDAWELLRAYLLKPLGVDEDAAGTSAAHDRPVWYHLKTLTSASLPALILLPWLVRRARAGRLGRGEPRLRWLWVVLVANFVAFSLLPQKQKHYMLPLLPPLALLLADGALSRAREDEAGFARLARRFGFVAAAVVAAATIGFVLWQLSLGLATPQAAVIAAAGLAAAVPLLAAARRGRPAQVGGACVGAWLVLFTIYALVIDPQRGLSLE